MNSRFRAATNQLTDTNQPKKIRRDLARLLTVMRERNLAVNRNG
jgi:ribosomal protein L29